MTPILSLDDATRILDVSDNDADQDAATRAVAFYARRQQAAIPAQYLASPPGLLAWIVEYTPDAHSIAVRSNILADAQAWLRALLEAPQLERPNLRLIGPPGTGKTRLAISLLEEGMHHLAADGFYLNVIEHVRAARQFENARAVARAADAFDRATRAPLAVLDEFGHSDALRATPFLHDEVYCLVNRRYGDGLPTIYVSQLSLEGIERWIGASVAGRLRENCRFIAQFSKLPNARRGA